MMKNTRGAVDNYTKNRKKLMSMRNTKIRNLYKRNYSMAKIADIIGVSSTTVFFAIRGR